VRAAFIDTIMKLADLDERVILLTGDIGFGVMEPFRARFPNRFINCGVAEQNMMGVATGLAEAGFIPYVYSIAPFVSLRPFEFIRNGPVAHHLPVRIVGMGAGFDYGNAGPTHFAVEDAAALRSLAGLTIVMPADGPQTATAVRTAHALPGPVYFSLAKESRPVVPGLDGRFELGKVQIVREGSGLALVVMGALANEAIAAAEVLARDYGIDAAVIVASNFNPDPVEPLAKILAGFSHIVSVEAQSVSSGLGACVGIAIARAGIQCRLHPLGIERVFAGSTGGAAHLWRENGLDRDSIVRVAASAFLPVASQAAIV